MLSRLFIAAFWSSAGKGLTSWLLFVMFNCVFVTFPCGILVQLWYLIASIPDLCHICYADGWVKMQILVKKTIITFHFLVCSVLSVLCKKKIKG